MTRDEFERYCFEGSQWTPATLGAVELAQAGFLPATDVDNFEREMAKPDGLIEVSRMQPLFVFEPVTVRLI